ncbi:MAG: FG-GAP-like repeat-containing protein [Rubripirellula sp.]
MKDRSFVLSLVSSLAVLLVLSCGCNRKDSADTTPARKVATPPQDPVAAVRVLLRRGNVAAAAQQVDAALLRTPEDPELLSIAGDVAVARGDAARAVELYELALAGAVTPDAGVLLKLGQEYMNVGRPFESIRVLKAAVEAYPEVVDYRMKLVGMQMAVGLEFESRQQLQWLVQRGNGGLNLLIVLSDLSRPQTVESTCNYALKTYPADLRPNYSLARLPAYHSEWKEAAELLTPVVEQHPEFVPGQALYGRALFELQRTPELSEWLKGVPSGIESEPQYWLTMGGVAEQNGNLPMAARAYWKATLLDENSGEALLKLSVTLAQLDQPDNARRLAERAAGITALRDGVDSLLSWKNNSQSDAVNIARGLEAMGRRWEATAWLQAAFRMTQNPQQDLASIYKSVRSNLTGATPWQIPEFAVAKQIDLSNYPKPVWLDSGSVSPVVSSPVSTHPMRFSDQAAERQLVHTCRLSKSEDEGGGLTIYQSGAGGVAVLDFDLDGWPDLCLTSIDGSPMKKDSSPNRFFRNLDGTFSDVTESSAIGGRGFSQGLAVGDYDADGFPDLFVANIGRNQLLRNNGDGTFSDITQQVALADEVWTSSAALADLDGDGLTDLFQLGYCETEKALQELCVDAELKEPRSCAPLAFAAQKDRVWRGTADGSYVDVTADWLSRHESGRGLGIVVGALDDRPGVDVYVANDMTANHYWSRSESAQNTAGAAGSEPTDGDATDGDATDGGSHKVGIGPRQSMNRPEFKLTEQASVRGLAVNGRSLSQASMGIAAGDADQDGDLDFLLTHFSGDYNTFYEQVASGMWADRSKRVGMIEPSQAMLGYGTQWIDADNDGTSELVVANGDIDDFTHRSRMYQQPAQMFQRQEGGTWGQAKSNSLGDYFQRDHLGRAVAKLDANRDQKPDLVITHLFEPIALLVNETKTDHLQCRFFFVGTKSGRDAIGARVTLQCEGKDRVGHLLAGDGFQCSNERCVGFGLGTQTEPCKVIVDWPDGTRESFGKLELSGDYLVIQGSGKLFAR